MVRQPEHEGAAPNEDCNTVRGQALVDSTWPDEDHLPLEGQEQDQAQEALEPVHVHVLLLG